MRLGKNVLAYFGELHPAVTKLLGLKQKIMAFEVFMDNIPEPRGSQSKARKKLELSNLQAVEKDLAFIVDSSALAADILAAAKTADRNFITEVRIFDVYAGDKLPEGKKSVAITLTMQPKEKTFSDMEIETLMNKVAVAVKQKVGGILRDQ